MQFQKHYTREQARKLLPQIRKWLRELRALREDLERCEAAIAEITKVGCDAGGPLVNEWTTSMAATRELLLEFFRREIQVKDLDRGLIDFPALMHGKEVFLCWENGEEDIAYWHDLKSGYAGRQKLE